MRLCDQPMSSTSARLLEANTYMSQPWDHQLWANWAVGSRLSARWMWAKKESQQIE